MTRIKVDFNNLVREGQIRAYVDDVEGGKPEVGDVIEAYDPAEDMSYEATVVELDSASGVVYLAPHWEPASIESSQSSGWVFNWTSSVHESHSATTYVYGGPLRVEAQSARANLAGLATC